MKVSIDDYKKEIQRMVNEINNLPRIIRIYSYVNRVFMLNNQEKEEA